MLTVEKRLSNKPFEWTGPHQLSASPPQAPCLPLKGSVSQPRTGAASLARFSIATLLSQTDSASLGLRYGAEICSF